MSGKKGSNQGKEPGDKLWVRLTCGFLGAVMVIAIVFMLIQTMSDRAITGVNAQGSANPESQKIRVGLCYGENAEQSFTLASANGFCLSDLAGKTLFSPDNLSVDFCSDGALSFVGVSVQESDQGVILTRPYHIQISAYVFRAGQIGSDGDNPALVNPPAQSGTSAQEPYNAENIDKYMSDLAGSGVLDNYTDSVYPAYVDGSYYIRIGQFDSEEEAQSTLAGLEQYVDFRASVVKSQGRGYTVLDGSDHSVVCEIVTPDKSVNVRAEQGALSDKNGVDYKGDLTFIREEGEAAGLRVINTFPLEDYVSAILPGEISQDCPAEAAKAMAVILRTNAYRMLGRHESDGFDVCTDHHCHVYSGASDEKLEDYVNQTAGQILLYGGQPIHAIYNISGGKTTVSALDAFGTEDYPYLGAAATPWEPESPWQAQFSPEDLRRILNTAGYSEIGTSVKSVQIDRTVGNSDTVSQITFTDYFGKSVTLSGTEAVRNLFGGILPSANFTVTVSDGSDGGRYGIFLFTGSGSGSGIGYSLSGGAAMAADGATYDTILATYYAGTTLLGGPTPPESLPAETTSGTAAQSPATDVPPPDTEE